MCIFSRPITEVSSTQIFARGVGALQYLVYGMKFSAAEELAMILPLPVPAGCGEEAVRFISFESYSDFFDDLDIAFPQQRPASDGYRTASLGRFQKPLAVHRVGGFDASFVPRMADFDRLDERFRVPRKTWEQLPVYRDYGFAVFKLRPGEQVHPMAFEFPRRDASQLYFPTLHIHDGQVHAAAEYDHALFAQFDSTDAGVGADQRAPAPGWWPSNRLVARYMELWRTSGVLSHDWCWKSELTGLRENRDAVVGPGLTLPALLEADPGPNESGSPRRPGHDEVDDELVEEYQQWCGALPEELTQILSRSGRALDLDEVHRLHEQACPDVNLRARSLFRLHAQDKYWSRVAPYQELAPLLLTRIPTETLVQALRDKRPGSVELEGAARFFTGYKFKGDPAAIPADLKVRLASHCAYVSDPIWRERADAAFGPAPLGWMACLIPVGFVALLAACCLAFSLVFHLVAYLVRPTPDAVLRLTIDQPGADIYVDDEQPRSSASAGQTLEYHLPSGSGRTHRVRISKPGFENYEQTFTPERDELREVEVQLTRSGWTPGPGL